MFNESSSGSSSSSLNTSQDDNLGKLLWKVILGGVSFIFLVLRLFV